MGVCLCVNDRNFNFSTGEIGHSVKGLFLTFTTSVITYTDKSFKAEAVYFDSQFKCKIHGNVSMMQELEAAAQLTLY